MIETYLLQASQKYVSKKYIWRTTLITDATVQIAATEYLSGYITDLRERQEIHIKATLIFRRS